jgi:hypothetical protein
MKYTMPHPSDQKKLFGAVASLPCQRCGAHGVQVAHSNSQQDGKGMGLKAWPWKVAALCPSCHVEIDSGKTLSKEERREAWLDAHVKTFSELFRLGHIRPV